MSTAPGGAVLGGRVAGIRVAVGLLVGVVAGLAGGALLAWADAPVIGWIAAAATFLGLTWAAVGRMDGEATAAHATREDPTAAVSRAGVLLASVASLAGVALILAHPSGAGRVGSAGLGIGSVAASWFVVHSLYTLQYAALYYGDPPGGIDFNGTTKPAYADFAYVGFTVGMAFTVSDTAVGASLIRRAVLRHALLSYLLGAVIVATTINLISGLVP
jgi:uncharacterized membrane protein